MSYASEFIVHLLIKYVVAVAATSTINTMRHCQEIIQVPERQMLHLWQLYVCVECRRVQMFPQIEDPPQEDDVNQFP